ncbi:hypothetical protein Ae505Ps2_5784c [Pseudonocardia sp. Ae505_Ps2]|nr:hypothetical protein Ae505Ps2_5784c [Pseudonocardia sp. Ae505_Ps2]
MGGTQRGPLAGRTVVELAGTVRRHGTEVFSVAGWQVVATRRGW